MESAGAFFFKNLQSSDEKSYFLQMSPGWRMTFGVLLLLSLLWGSVMKSFIYSYLKCCKVIDKPINFMIMLSQILHHILHIFIGTNLLIELLVGVSPIDFAKDYLNTEVNSVVYCTTFYFFGVFNTTYLIVSNALLGIYRLILLTLPRLATKLLGNYSFVIFAISGSLLISTVLSGLFIHEKSSSRAILNLCVGRSQKFQVRLYGNIMILSMHLMAINVLGHFSFD